MTRSLFCVAALIVTSAGIGLGCKGGVQPGDTVVYRVAYADPKLSSSCYYPDNQIPPDVKSDSNSLRTSATMVVYAGANDALYLDLGDLVLEGTVSDKTYSFDGKAVDVEYSDPTGQGTKTTTTTTTHLEMTVDGESVTGTRTDKITLKCSGGTGCNSSASCTETMEFVGTQVDNVDLKHDI